jgi:hypothetical protein
LIPCSCVYVDPKTKRVKITHRQYSLEVDVELLPDVYFKIDGLYQFIGETFIEENEVSGGNPPRSLHAEAISVVWNLQE